jgi:hypothetical protein
LNLQNIGHPHARKPICWCEQRRTQRESVIRPRFVRAAFKASIRVIAAHRILQQIETGSVCFATFSGKLATLAGKLRPAHISTAPVFPGHGARNPVP